MPYSLVANDIVETRINYLMNGQKLMNVFHYKMNGNGLTDEGAVEIQETAANIAAGVDQWVATWLESGSSSCRITSVEAQKIFPMRFPYRNTIVNEVGTNITPALPQNIQLSIEKVGEVANRHGIGRIEVPGIPTEYTEEGRVTSDGLDWLVELATAALLPIASPFPLDVELRPIIFNRSVPGDSQAFIGSRLGTTVRVARRRTVGVGE